MSNSNKCPICLSQDGYPCTSSQYGSRDATLFKCAVCGDFAISSSALADNFTLPSAIFNRAKRAALSHALRSGQGLSRETRLLTTYDFDDSVVSELKLPNPVQQSRNAIAFIGDYVSQNAENITELPPYFGAMIGAPSLNDAKEILDQLKGYGLISAISMKNFGGVIIQNIDLTLNGWDKYEEERRGKISGNYGFMALQFGDSILDGLLCNHIKPAVSKIGFELIDLRDVARAGIIDNILRMQIRDAAFVIVDLTHENPGAYWEAGYAEGLGKPVLYICEQTKFEEKKTHFDTNHCTTVMWNVDNPSEFVDRFVATLRRSIA